MDSGDNLALVVSNPHGYPPFSEGEGAPYAPVNWPEVGDVWGWRVGNRVSGQNKYYYDRYLIAPTRLWERPTRKLRFRSKKETSDYLEAEFPNRDTSSFWSSFCWDVPAQEGFHGEDVGPSNTKRKGVRKEAEGEGVRKEAKAKGVRKQAFRAEKVKANAHPECEEGRATVVGRKHTRSVRREILSQPIGVQFKNSREDPLVLDDAEATEDTFTVCGVPIDAPFFYRGGKQVMGKTALLQAIDRVMPSMTAEQRRLLEERKQVLQNKGK